MTKMLHSEIFQKNLSSDLLLKAHFQKTPETTMPKFSYNEHFRIIQSWSVGGAVQEHSIVTDEVENDFSAQQDFIPEKYSSRKMALLR
ncbi:hypothetical protein M3I01_017180 [Marinomonas sp. RSW2]|uniref:Uncharacterized protein n=2 Tax=Marinomonas maritima TaxID=2940935 RepID=A0ABT5WIF5_9GAMM|nr:hypothetical protein [Marinomonas maritima]